MQVRRIAKLATYFLLGALLIYSIATKQQILPGVVAILLTAYMLWKQPPQDNGQKKLLWFALFTLVLSLIGVLLLGGNR